MGYKNKSGVQRDRTDIHIKTSKKWNRRRGGTANINHTDMVWDQLVATVQEARYGYPEEYQKEDQVLMEEQTLEDERLVRLADETRYEV